MRKALITSGILIAALLLSGCATSRSVQRMMDENNAVYDQAIAQVEERVEELSEDQENQKGNLLSYLRKQNQLLAEFIEQLEAKAETEQPAPAE